MIFLKGVNKFFNDNFYYIIFQKILVDYGFNLLYTRYEKGPMFMDLQARQSISIILEFSLLFIV